MASAEETNNNIHDIDNTQDSGEDLKTVKSNEQICDSEPCGMNQHPENIRYTDKLDSDMILSIDENTQLDDESLDHDASQLGLLDLPSELLIHIASFLESRVIIDVLSQVCQMLSDLFSSERYWKTRISLRWPKPYPVVESEYKYKTE